MATITTWTSRGVLAVVGLARDSTVTDRTATIAAAPVVRIVKTVRRAPGPEGMRATQPRTSYREVRTTGRWLLPGVRYRGHVLRRYSLTWQKPA